MRQQVHIRWWACAGFYALILSMMGWPGSAAGQGVLTAGRAPDPTGQGEFAVATSIYRLPASTDPTIMTDRFTEIFARVWRPQTEELERLPLVIFLHGNHGTCGTFFCRAAICGHVIPLPDGPRIDDRRDYTFTGTCPRAGEGTPPAEFDYVFSPSHEGYAYLAEQLASRGYLVVSINANRGITAGPAQDLGTPGNPFIEDRGLNLARARLVLKHLEMLSRWNRGIDPTPDSLGFSLQGAINFHKVALVGHSRGGEGVRGAYNIYTGRNTDINPYAAIDWRSRIVSAVTFKGIFEIAPVDRQTVRTLNAEGTTWSVMLPGCDGDVINQQGLWPYDRMMESFTEQPARQKAFYYVLGANHNYWNTEWQFSDSSGCFDSSLQLFVTDPDTGILPGVTGSARQRTTGSGSILALIRGAVRSSDGDSEGEDGDSSRFLTNFDPQFRLPAVVTTAARIQRGFIASPSSEVTQSLEDFEQPTGTSQFGVPNDASNVTVEHVAVNEHGIPFNFRNPDGSLTRLPAFLHAGRVAWQSAGADVFFQINFSAAGSGLDLSDFATLDFRVDRESPKKTALNAIASSSFHVQLVAADGTLSEPVSVSNFIELVGPFGTPDADLSFIPQFAAVDGYHINMSTARIPIEAFRSGNLSQTRGIRLTFDVTATGKIYVTNFRASRKGIRSLDQDSDKSESVDSILTAPASSQSRRIIEQGNVIENVQFVRPSGVGEAATNSSGTVRFTVWSNTPILVGNELPIMSIGSVQCDGSYVDGSTQRMMFECPAQGLWLADGERIIVRSNARTIWSFGNFSSSMMN